MEKSRVELEVVEELKVGKTQVYVEVGKLEEEQKVGKTHV